MRGPRRRWPWRRAGSRRRSATSRPSPIGSGPPATSATPSPASSPPPPRASRGPRGAGGAARGRSRGAGAARRGRAGRDAARERLRAADDRARAADVGALEARLNLDSLREQLLVELAGLGEVGLRHLAAAGGVEPRRADGPHARPPATDSEGGDGDGAATSATEAAETAALEAALDLLAPRWAAEPAAGELPSSGPPGHAAPPLPRAGRRQPVRRGRVPGRPGAPRDAGRPGSGPARGDREDAGADRRPRRPDRDPVPDDVRGARGRLRRPVPAAVRRWLRQAHAHRPVRPVGHRHRDHRPTRRARSPRRSRCSRAGSAP